MIKIKRTNASGHAAVSHPPVQGKTEARTVDSPHSIPTYSRRRRRCPTPCHDFTRTPRPISPLADRLVRACRCGKHRAGFRNLQPVDPKNPPNTGQHLFHQRCDGIQFYRANFFVFQPHTFDAPGQATKFIIVTTVSLYVIQNVVIYLTTNVWMKPVRWANSATQKSSRADGVRPLSARTLSSCWPLDAALCGISFGTASTCTFKLGQALDQPGHLRRRRKTR